MRYPDYAPEVNAVLDVARSIRKMAQVTGTDSGNLMQYLDEPAGDWILSLLEIVLDHEERRDRAARRLKVRRMKKRVPSNVTYIGEKK
ncbi:MAG TPA: hypothetical protein VE974_05995 [Thermoanaerobaculia bacterium]|nr:hypothetical protein [Thermoanaerobaculia bacterium]